jgi:hypothetical protein
VGDNIAASSANGILWTPRTIPAGVYQSLAWNLGTNSLFAAVGAGVAASGTGAATWTTRTIPAGSYNAVAWKAGTIFSAVGNEVAASSPDGTTAYTARTLPASAIAKRTAGGVVET